MIDVKTATTAQLVAYYNAHLAEGAKAIKKFVNRATAEKRVAALVAALTPTEVKAAKAAAKKPPKHVQNKVVVDGTEYRSVRAAFDALKLPMGRHIKFRMKLKEAGELKFDDKHNFVVVPK